jgi:hypothetical protein
MTLDLFLRVNWAGTGKFKFQNNQVGLEGKRAFDMRRSGEKHCMQYSVNIINYNDFH